MIAVLREDGGDEDPLGGQLEAALDAKSPELRRTYEQRLFETVQERADRHAHEGTRLTAAVEEVLTPEQFRLLNEIASRPRAGMIIQGGGGFMIQG
jgi:hypothetical protein